MEKKVKSRTPCFVAGCLIVSIVFVVIVVMLSVLFLHIPEAADLYSRVSKQSKFNSVLLNEEKGMDLSKLSEQSRGIYESLQAEYRAAHAEGDGALSFPCSDIVEYYSNNEKADSKDYIYGMLVYTDSISTAYDVFTTYYRVAGDQGVDFSDTDFFLFVRGNAVFVGNGRAFLKAFFNNIL